MLFTLTKFDKFPLESFAHLYLCKGLLLGAHVDILNIIYIGLGKSICSLSIFRLIRGYEFVAISTYPTFSSIEICSLLLWGIRQSVKLLCATDSTVNM